MKPATQSSLILVGTLAIGILLGSVLTGSLARQRTRQVEELRERGGFIEQIERAIQPRDEEQRRAVRPIIETTARENAAIVEEMHTGLRSAMEEMIAELEPLLDPEQYERLSRIARMPPPRAGAPPPPGPPGRPPPRGR
jgi:hypothetical protein